MRSEPDPRSLPGVAPSLEGLLAHETEGRDDVIDPRFFAALDGRAVTERTWPGWEGPPNLFPMIYSDASLLSATWTLPVDEAAALLPPTERLTPMRLTPGRAALVVFAFDYRRGGLGAYRELGVAVPVLLDARRTPPLWPALRDRLKPGSHPRLGMYAVALPVDRPRACEAGIRLYGLPKLVGEAEFALNADGGRGAMTHDGRRMGDLSVRLAANAPRAKRLDLAFRTLSVLDGRIVRTRYAVVAEGYRGRDGWADFTPGEHPGFAPFHGLALSERPIEVRRVPRLNWIIEEPEDAGPA